MKIQSANFIGSYPDRTTCPEPTLPEYAFVGRSNVGKSSLINALVGKKKLAKTSGTPGKTKGINFFDINNQWHLVDLPGYGWAKVSKSMRKQFERMLNDYLALREGLLCTFVLIDIRHKPQPIDLDFMRWMGQSGIPFEIVFTKADKLKKQEEINQAVSSYQEEMLKEWEFLPEFFITSAEKKQGVDKILDEIDRINKLFEKEKKMH